MNITDNFTLEELIESSTAKRLHIDNTPSEYIKNNLSKLARTILQPLRNEYHKKINIDSGYRCQKLNSIVKGVPSSQHTKGEAADINNGIPENRHLFNIAKQMIEKGQIVVGQLIDERNGQWIHISLPDNKHKNQILYL